MLASADLLAPIPGPSRAGSDVRYEPIYDQIKEARREDDDAPQGDWQRARKVADWPLVTRLATETLAKKSKDLQVAAWLVEAQLRQRGFAGLRDGLEIVRALVEQYWDDVYPALEDDDLELRAAPLEWIGLKLDIAVRQVPLNKAGHDVLQYRTSRLVGYEADAQDSDKAEGRAKAIAEGKLTAEEFDEGFDATPKAWYKTLVADHEGAVAALRALEATCDARFGREAPSFRRLLEALEEVGHVAAQFLKRKLELDPDPAPEVEVPLDASQEPLEDGASDGAAPRARSATAGALAPEPVSREDAAARIIGAAKYLRRENPTSPAPYLLLRGFRWGELRAGGSTPDPRLLEAPPTNVRAQLKGLLLDERWSDLLEACETVMGAPYGRGWLDLQRYALTACVGLGGGFDDVAAAIRAQLRTLLMEMPSLPAMTMMDDTPTANAETLAWLNDVILAGGSDPTEAVKLLHGAAAARPTNGARRHEPAHEQALAEVRAGRADKAVHALMRELDRETTPRGRFLRQVQIADIMMEAGLDAVARPILEELVTKIEEHRLEDWEAGDLIARPMVLLYRCLASTSAEPEAMQSLYLRICRLDPVQAMSFAQA